MYDIIELMDDKNKRRRDQHTMEFQFKIPEEKTCQCTDLHEDIYMNGIEVTGKLGRGTVRKEVQNVTCRVELPICGLCGKISESHIDDTDLQNAMKEAEFNYCKSQGMITPEDLKELRRRLKWSARQMGYFLDYEKQTIYAWENYSRAMPKKVNDRVMMLYEERSFDLGLEG